MNDKQAEIKRTFQELKDAIGIAVNSEDFAERYNALTSSIPEVIKPFPASDTRDPIVFKDGDKLREGRIEAMSWDKEKGCRVVTIDVEHKGPDDDGIYLDEVAGEYEANLCVHPRKAHE